MTYWKDSCKLKSALKLIAELIDCGETDADEVLRLIDLHGSDVIYEAKQLSEDQDTRMTFYHIIAGVHRVVALRLRDVIENAEENLTFYNEWTTDLTIDANYIAWGSVADYGCCPEEVGEIFSEMMKDGITEERKQSFLEAFREGVKSLLNG